MRFVKAPTPETMPPTSKNSGSPLTTPWTARAGLHAAGGVRGAG